MLTSSRYSHCLFFYRFIAAFSLAIGLGVTIFPWAFMDPRGSPYTANFWRCENCSETMKGIRNAVSIILTTGYCVGAICAILLDLILPADAKVIDAETRKNRKLQHKHEKNGGNPDRTAEFSSDEEVDQTKGVDIGQLDVTGSTRSLEEMPL